MEGITAIDARVVELEEVVASDPERVPDEADVLVAQPFGRDRLIAPLVFHVAVNRVQALA
jgi:hypothetical protein